MSNDKPQTPKPKTKQQTLTQKKVFDVMRPGKAPASPNSRNVIVGHKKPVKEDMFVAGAESHGSRASNPDEDRALMKKTGKVSLAPVSADMEASAPPVRRKEASAAIAALGGKATEAQVTATSAPELNEASLEIASQEVAAPPSSAQPDDTMATAPLLDKKMASAALGQGATEPSSNNFGPKTESQPQPSTFEPQLSPEAADSDGQSSVAPLGDSPSSSGPSATSEAHQDGYDTIPQSIHHDIVAQTSAPMLELDRAVVSHHKHRTRWWTWVMLFFAIIILGLVVLNFLLDAELLTTEMQVPHTDLIN